MEAGAGRSPAPLAWDLGDHFRQVLSASGSGTGQYRAVVLKGETQSWRQGSGSRLGRALHAPSEEWEGIKDPRVGCYIHCSYAGRFPTARRQQNLYGRQQWDPAGLDRRLWEGASLGLQ